MMRRWWLGVLLLLFPAVLSARTWLVQQDSTGDFTDIQSAVDAASVGDTVLVGPGRYDTFHAVPDAPESWRVVVDVTTDSLTIRGIDRDLAIIGPTEPYPPPPEARVRWWREKKPVPGHPRPSHGIEQWEVGGEKRIYSYGITSGLTVTWITIENLTFEYTDNGVDVYPAGEVRDCTFRHMHDAGVVGDKGLALDVEGCLFQRCNTAIGIQAYGEGQTSCKIYNCHGDTVSVLVYSQDHPDVLVEDCTAWGALLTVYGGHVRVNNCRAEHGEEPIYIAGGQALVEVNDCELLPGPGWGSTLIMQYATLTGTGNILHGADGYPTIKGGNCTLDFHGNHILHGNYPYTVQIDFHNGPADAVDLRNNYWGTTSADTLAAWIWDGHDDPSVQTYVQYEPFSPVPIPTRKQSWGGVKALFR